MHVLYEKKNDLTLPKYLIVKRKEGEQEWGERERESKRACFRIRICDWGEYF